MFRSPQRLSFAAAVLALVSGLAAPASAQQWASNHNVWAVRHRIEFDIRQLAQDQRDYDGDRARAMNQMQAARNQLLAAEEFVHHEPLGGGAGDPGSLPVDRGQYGSNRNLWFVRHDVERQIANLANDASDYGGHKAAAMRELQRARGYLLAGEDFARSHGY